MTVIATIFVIFLVCIRPASLHDHLFNQLLLGGGILPVCPLHGLLGNNSEAPTIGCEQLAPSCHATKYIIGY